MRLSSTFAIALLFAGAAGLCVVGANFAVSAVEDGSRQAVDKELTAQDLNWTEVDANGLQIFLAGTAPSEAARFNALTAAGGVVDAARVIDQMLVADSIVSAPPRFSIEILRHDQGISLIGLIPIETDREALIAEIEDATDGEPIADLLEAADYPVPATWEDALDFAVRSLEDLPRTKISVEADHVSVTAMAEGRAEKATLESDLARDVPRDVRLKLDISAPRPVITPFTLRFVIENGTARFDACSADSEKARNAIIKAAGQAGVDGKIDCTIGLGVPSPNWAKAAELAIGAVADFQGGSVTFSDADVSLIAHEGVSQNHFDDVVGQLETSLPDVFTLHATLPEQVVLDADNTPEFVATLSPEGLVQIRGQVGSERSRQTVDSLAKARFASDVVRTQARLAEALPHNWPVRTLTGIEALAYLSSGAVTVTPDSLSVQGKTGQPDASAKVSAMLADKLGEGAQFDINISYIEALDPVASLPTPDECEDRVGQMQRGRKINFEPGSPNVDEQSGDILDDIAEILKECGKIKLEIGGHTDSQGREEMNQQLSQTRAQAILNELRERRVLTSSFTAVGYGESQPIEDNKTEEGREANRRIEFKLIRPAPIVEEESTLDAIAEPVDQPLEAGAEREATQETQAEEDQAEEGEATDEQN
ncbi:Outer membrane porin F precursor [Roseovarius albus]|uniref:Outer membrane porin F n=1 Tax=Roseovarius albus TaxID=1247867 RepID=A0A1X6Y9H0_9RHOB|nr:OmpA family protein [Roseovarius albus]SLN14748.1 Outer membrane porin F precursor [Roseovarius albus]